MIRTLSYAYIYVLAGLLALLILGTLTLHLSYLFGSGFEPNGRALVLFCAVNIPIAGLAKDRSIWRHELPKCPAWMRTIAWSLGAYTTMVVVICIINNMHVPGNFFLTVTAFMLTFSFYSACVLYATFVDKTDLVEFRLRIKQSILTTVLVYFLVSLRLLLPHTLRSY